ncbi:MAG: hypothetical protein IJK59_04950 [Firmicutes bacterium]|nr:hypothetical protein [Bacillota bacterium]MBR0114130.1 hypothetical protein [Bacillota bacterium]
MANSSIINKIKRSMPGLFSGLICVVMLLTSLTVALADEFNIDSSGFKDPTITKSMVYYWHKGVPPIRPDAKHTAYPVLLVWDDKYYLLADSNFQDMLKNGEQTHRIARRWEDLPYQTRESDWSNKLDIPRDKGTESSPAGMFHRVRRYPMKETARVDQLDFDFESVKNGGTAVSLSLPPLPRFIAVYEPTDIPKGYVWGGGLASRLELRKEADDRFTDWTQSYLGIGRTEKQYGEVQGQVGYYAIQVPYADYESGYAWLTGDYSFHVDYDEFDQFFGTKAVQTASFDWYLGIESPVATSNVASGSDRSLGGTVANWTDPNWRMKPFASGSKDVLPDKNITLRRRSWLAFQTTDGKYHLQTNSNYGFYVESYYPDQDRANIQNHVRYMDLYADMISLMHSRSNLATAAGNGFSADHYLDNTLNNSYDIGFDIYYAEPVPMSFIQTSFTVQDGQVSSLDGPIVIGSNATIYVKDGGVLSVSGWVINNGTIVVEPGGTLLVQELETDNDSLSEGYGVLAPMQEPGAEGGRIVCDGTMIVMPDCKVVGGGKTGIIFSEGAHCVNYGAIISENFEVYQDHTIENRKDGRVFVGVGLEGGGLQLVSSRITGQDYPGMSIREDTAAARIAKDGIYGNDNIFMISSSHSIDTDMANRTGHRGEQIHYEDDARSSVVYYDKIIEVYWFESSIDGRIYYFDKDLQRYVFVNDSGDVSYFKGNAPVPSSSDTEYNAKSLPDGYRTRSGVIGPNSGRDAATDYENNTVYYDPELKVYYFVDLRSFEHSGDRSEIYIYYYSEKMKMYYELRYIGPVYLSSKMTDPRLLTDVPEKEIPYFVVPDNQKEQLKNHQY